MEHRLTVKELSEILNISVQATNKKVNKLEESGLKTTHEVIHNRLTKVVIINENQLNELKSNTMVNKPYVQQLNRVTQTINQVEQSINESVEQHLNNPPKQIDYNEIVTRILDFTENTNKQMQELFQQVSNSELQVRLLEDSENRTKREYVETNAQNIQLNQQNQELQNKVEQLETELEQLKQQVENHKKPFWAKLTR